jgi:uncharacterized protein (DUF433 family)
MNWQEYIVSDKGVLLGKPTIKGTRLSVDHIMSLFAQGWTEDQVLENYSRLTKDSIRATLLTQKKIADVRFINFPKN